MVKRLQRLSEEVSILVELNRPQVRTDPWNPAPYLLRLSNRGDSVYLLLERLQPYDKPPLQTIGNYIDLIRQILEVTTLRIDLD
jgi:hypothetical protein